MKQLLMGMILMLMAFGFPPPVFADCGSDCASSCTGSGKAYEDCMVDCIYNCIENDPPDVPDVPQPTPANPDE